MSDTKNVDTKVQYRLTIYGSDGSEWDSGWRWPDFEGYWLEPQVPANFRKCLQSLQDLFLWGKLPADGKRTYKIEKREVTYGEPVLLGTGGSETS